MKGPRKFLLIIPAVLVLPALVWLFFYIRDYDTRALHRLVGELEDIAAKRPGRSNALALLDAATPERVFASRIIVRSKKPDIERELTLKELGQLLVSMKKSCQSSALDINIDSLIIDGDRAEISGDALLSGNSGKGSFREARMVKLECSKVKGKWKIAGLDIFPLITR